MAAFTPSVFPSPHPLRPETRGLRRGGHRRGPVPPPTPPSSDSRGNNPIVRVYPGRRPNAPTDSFPLTYTGASGRGRCVPDRVPPHGGGRTPFPAAGCIGAADI